MAEPYLICPAQWESGTLAPNPVSGLISHVSSGGTPSTTNEEFWDGDVLWLTPKEIARGYQGLYVTQTERMISSEGLRNSGAKLQPAGTVMLTKRAPVGAVAVAAVPMSTNQGFLNFTCGPRLSPLYLAYWLLANRPYLDAVANGSTYPELYKTDLYEFQISVPELSEQEAIVAFLLAFDFVILSGLPLEQTVRELSALPALQSQTRRLQALRRDLMRALLSGRISVTDLPTLASGGERGFALRDGRLPAP